MSDILAAFGLTQDQRRAATVQGRDVVVTAGAGSGKTRTLAARYLWLLEQGVQPRRIVAITFTEKAARALRHRIRRAISRRVQTLGEGEQARVWRALEASMDAARIGTIHSLCAEILRHHPAEAGIDPQFEVLDEGLAAALRAQAVEDALVWAAGDQDVAQLFASHTLNRLRALLTRLLERRLDLPLDDLPALQGAEARLLARTLADFLTHPEVRWPLEALRSLDEGQALVADGGEKLAGQVEALLAGWQEVESALEAGRAWEAAAMLFQLRRACMDLRSGKQGSAAKEHLTSLRKAYDRHANPWLGGAKSSDPPPDPEAERVLAQNLPRLGRLCRQALENYRQARQRLWSLDFDDLEGGALALLQDPAVRARWSAAFEALLVDEFQDTNARQRAIIDALTSDRPGKLLVVGDARQSIYRFRGADVTVFRDLQDDVQARGGALVRLDRTFRAHAALLEGLDGILPAVMGTAPDPQQPYAVPYIPLEAHRQDPRAGTAPPYLEMILGLGERADDARPMAASALAGRLLELKEQGEIGAWDNVALLFRAASGFEAYERALEAHGIPFLTVAGGGFYDRPEVRDLLNILQALAEPWNDAAMAGLLRSPAIGMSDAGVCTLRAGLDGRKRTFMAALEGDLSMLSDADRRAAQRAQDLLADLGPLVERVPVAELLKRVVDALDLRALLAVGEARLWRNVDKLLEDARASGLVRVGAFFQYLRTLRATGVREGEAPAEAVGAVRLMTVHKAKGLEFEVVVLADASRQPRGGSEPVYVLPGQGLAWKPDLLEALPMTYAIARWMDQRQSKAEEDRILYVAMTRAREKLIVSGYLTRPRGRWSAAGWTDELLGILGLTPDEVADSPGIWQRVSLTGRVEVGVQVASLEGEVRRAPAEAQEWPASRVRSLVAPLVVPPVESLDPNLAAEPERAWRATGRRVHPPALVVGLMVHRALERWVFPGDRALPGLLETVALKEGLVDPGQRARAMRQATKLLERFQRHPLRAEIERAAARYHEVPYSRPLPDGRSDAGAIDLLYRTDEGWTIVDYKVDALHDQAELEKAIQEHRPQLARYEAACRELLGVPARAVLCFLDYRGEVRVV